MGIVLLILKSDAFDYQEEKRKNTRTHTDNSLG